VAIRKRPGQLSLVQCRIQHRALRGISSRPLFSLSFRDWNCWRSARLGSLGSDSSPIFAGISAVVGVHRRGQLKAFGSPARVFPPMRAAEREGPKFVPLLHPTPPRGCLAAGRHDAGSPDCDETLSINGQAHHRSAHLPCGYRGVGQFSEAEPFDNLLPHEDSTPGTVKPFRVSLVEPVAYQFQLTHRQPL